MLVVTRSHARVVGKAVPAWRDPRFVIGFALIALSICATVLLVHAARTGLPLYQATRDVAVGESLDDSNTRVVLARPESDGYVREGALAPGSVASRSIGRGELLPSGSVARSGDLELRRITLSVAQGLPESTAVGATLELWSVPESSAGRESAAPRLVAPDVVLARILEDSRALGSETGTRIEAVVPASEIAAVLSATGQGGRLVAVPVGS